jgi:hypothetical protein
MKHRPLRRHVALLLTLAALLTISLVPHVSSAASTGADDDPAANTPSAALKPVGLDRNPNDAGGPYPVGALGSTAGPTGCDTVNPFLTQNRNTIVYNNQTPNAANTRSCVSDADITHWTLTTNTNGTITWTTTVRGVIPDEGVEAAAISNGGTSFNYDIYFQNAATQNRRQRVGDAADCTRGAYQGPFLTGNGEYLRFYWSNALDAASNKFGKPTFGFAHYDPVGNLNYQTRFAPGNFDGAGSQKCTGSPVATHTELTSGSTGVSYSVSSDKHTVSVTIPMHYCWVNKGLVLNCYDIAELGKSQTLNNIFVTSGAEVWLVRTPDLSNINPALHPTGVGQTFVLDWAPWGAFDLGTHPAQGDRVPGPTCPNFNASQYFQPDPDGPAPGGTYVNSPNNLAKEDRQVNPLYGLANYDAAGTGSVDNDLGPLPDQGHGGGIECDPQIVTAPHFADTSYSVAVG